MPERKQIALVTGGGRGLGRRIALRLAEDGADVAIIGPEQQELDQTERELQQFGRRSMAVLTDITVESQISVAVSQVRQTLGSVDVLVNNAGIMGPTARIQDVERDDWDTTLAVNLTGAFMCSKSVVGDMIERQSGRIINISSIAGKFGYPLRSPYAASKWGMIGLTLTLAKELGDYNIQVNAICPGPVDGPRIQAVISHRAEQLGCSVEDIRTEYLQESALNRMVNASDIAAMVAYLASPAGNNITGQAIDVSAGYAL